MQEVLRLTISPNETNSPERIKDLMRAIESFKGQIVYGGKDSEQPADICLLSQTKRIHVELKKPNDWVSSVLFGHLYEQVLTLREWGQPAIILILGDTADIYKAIKESASGRGLRGPDIAHVIASNHARCKSFRKRAFLNNIRVFWKGDDSGFFDGDDTFEDLLEFALDFFLEGDMIGFRPKPADGERDIAAASMLFKGIGDESMTNLLKEYDIGFFPKHGARPIEEIPGFGKKRCDQIRSRVKYK